MAATLARGETVLENAAREPEIVDLADCLVAMAHASAAPAPLSSPSTASTALAAPCIRSFLTHRDRHLCHGGRHGRRRRDLEGARAELLETALDVIRRTGTEIQPVNSGIRVSRNGSGIAPVDITNRAVPRLPTDLQAQFMGLMTMAKGNEDHRDDLREPLHACARTGPARAPYQPVRPDGDRRGRVEVKGAPVMATDLRASVSLVIAGLCRRRRDHGQPRLPSRPRLRALEEKLSGCGAVIERITLNFLLPVHGEKVPEGRMRAAYPLPGRLGADVASISRV